MIYMAVGVQGSAKEWSRGCVNLRAVAGVSQEAGFTQPRDHSFVQPYIYSHIRLMDHQITQLMVQVSTRRLVCILML